MKDARSIRALLYLLVAGGLLAAAGFAAATGRTAVVIVDRLNLRPAPGTDAPPFATLERGEVVTVLDEDSEWWKVLVDHRLGYISRQGKFLSFTPPAPGGTGGDAGRPAVELRRQIAQQQEAVAATASEENRVLGRLHRADRALAAARVRLARLRADIEALENRIGDASDAYQALEEKIQHDAEYVKQRLVAAYKLGRLGNLQLLASAGSIADLQRRRTALASILEYDRLKLAGYSRKAALTAELVADLTQSRAQKQALETQAEAALAAAARENAEKMRLIEEIRSQKALQLAALAALEQSARALDRAVAEIKPGPDSTTPEAILESAAFGNSKGLLNMPVRGKITSFYGPYRHPTYNVTNFNGGIGIRAEHGEPVEAVWQGVVAYSGWFRGYGNLIIVNHGDNYHTLYAHLAERFKSRGDRVEKGEIIGTVGETGPVSGPELHFQVRSHGKTLDPLDWIQQG